MRLYVKYSEKIGNNFKWQIVSTLPDGKIETLNNLKKQN